jgi:DNA-binding response OmpR family regulator
MTTKKKYRIMVVDDDQFIRAILENYLKTYYEIISKPDAQEAMAWLESGNEIDLILADINMPGMNGIEMLQQLRSSGFFRNIPFLMLSGNKDTGEKIKCLKAGADDYIVKPFNPEEVYVRIENILRRIGVAVKHSN